MAQKYQGYLIRVSWYTPSNQGPQTKHKAPQSISPHKGPHLGFNGQINAQEAKHKNPQ